jgi:hypothetical protein
MQFHIFIIELQYQYLNKLHYSYTSIVQNFEKKNHNTGTNLHSLTGRNYEQFRLYTNGYM